jgi:hypothetical protein
MIFDVLRVDGMDAMCLSPSGEHDSSQALPTQRIGQTRAATGMSQTAISRIWRAFALKPYQVETFKLSPDPQFIDKVRDIVGLYLNPPEAAVVLCVDEKSQIQALDRSAPVLPLLPGCRRGRPMTTSATAPPTSTPRSMSPLGR